MGRNNEPDQSVNGAGHASSAEVAAWASNLSEAFLLCREIGHKWNPHTAAWRSEQRCYERSLRCTRCRTRRLQLLTSYGAVISSQYIYPDGYQHKGFGRVIGDGRDALRLESIQRLVEV